MAEIVHHVFDNEPGKLPEEFNQERWWLRDGARFAYPRSIWKIFLEPETLREDPDYVVTNLSVSTIGYDTKFGIWVWLKIPNQQNSGDLFDIDAFRQEVKTQASFLHPNIVPVYDVDELRFGDSRLPISVSAYVDGVSLNRAGRFVKGEAKILDIVGDVASALDYVHKKGWIHRDVKPGNILISKTGEVKLCDFGFAIKINDVVEARGGGFVKGTALYSAPETMIALNRGNRVLNKFMTRLSGRGGKLINDRFWLTAPTADVYSLGVSVYQFFSDLEKCASRFGKTGWELEDGSVMPHVSEGQKMVWLPNISEATNMVLERAMAFYPEDRYQSAGDFARDLRRAYSFWG